MNVYAILLAAFLSLVAALPALSLPKVVGAGDSQTRRVTVQAVNGDTGDSPAIPNSCAVWRGSFSGTGSMLVYALTDASAAASSGTLLGTFSSSSAAVTTFETSWPWLKADVTAPGSGTDSLFLYCAREASSGALAANVVKIAEDYPGADFSDQLQAAAAASPAGGTVLITESHSVAGTANMDDADTTILCTPGVTLTKTGSAGESMFIFTAARPTLRDCTLQGDAASIDAFGVKIEVGADGALIEGNTILDFNRQAILLDSAAAGTLLSDVTIRGNYISQTLGGIDDSHLIHASNDTLVDHYRVLDNTLISRGNEGNPFFLFAGVGSKNIILRGNTMECEGIDASNRCTGCMEFAVANGPTITHPDDYMTGVSVDGNTCHTYDFTDFGMGIGMMHGGTFSNNVIRHLGTTQGYPTVNGAEFGNLYQVTISGNTWSQELGNGISIHDVQYVNFSNNVVEHGWLGGTGYGVKVESGGAPDYDTRFQETHHVSIIGNTFRTKAPDDKNLYSVFVRCNGTSFSTLDINDVLIADNTFDGPGDPGTSESAAVALQQESTQGNCVIGPVQIEGNQIDDYNFALWTNNHVFTDTTFIDNHLTNIGTSEIDVGNGASTGFLIKGQSADPPVDGTECAIGSLWIDTDTASDTNCTTGANGDLCTCDGATWTAK